MSSRIERVVVCAALLVVGGCSAQHLPPGAGTPNIVDSGTTDAGSGSDSAASMDSTVVQTFDFGVVNTDATISTTTQGDVTITVSADDAYTGYMDGVMFGMDSGWSTEHTYDFTLTAGHHVFAFAVTDIGGVVEGFIADVTRHGINIAQTGHGPWLCTNTSEAGFADVTHDTSTWHAAGNCSYGPAGRPWGANPPGLRSRDTQWIGCGGRGGGGMTPGGPGTMVFPSADVPPPPPADAGAADAGEADAGMPDPYANCGNLAPSWYRLEFDVPADVLQ